MPNEELTRATVLGPRLEAWLTHHNAIPLWEQRVANVGRITCFRVGSSICLIMTYKQGGWEMLTGQPSNDIETTLADAEARLGLK